MKRGFSSIGIIFVSVLVTTVLLLGATKWVFENHRSEIATYLLESVPNEVIAGKVVLPETSDERVKSAIERANPAVVSVVITKDIPTFERFLERVPFGFFGSVLVPRVRQSGTESVEVGGGSGFIISRDGLIVTNRHVVDDDTASYSILTNEGLSYEVTVAAKDPVLDVAILKIDEPPAEDLPWLDFGDSESLQLGESVIAIGNALAEFRNSVSTGVVSGLSRTIIAGDRQGMSTELEGLIQTDAAINPGNSGGPLINLEGEVLGVNVAASTDAENIGFALPAHIVEEVVRELVVNQ